MFHHLSQSASSLPQGRSISLGRKAGRGGDLRALKTFILIHLLPIPLSRRNDGYSCFKAETVPYSLKLLATQLFSTSQGDTWQGENWAVYFPRESLHGPAQSYVLAIFHKHENALETNSPCLLFYFYLLSLKETVKANEYATGFLTKSKKKQTNWGSGSYNQEE